MGNTVTVKTSCGSLRGSVEKSIEDYEYYAFKGVPYAKPPIGDLRFQDPQPPESWKGVRDALNFGPVCAQYDQLERKYFGNDDCLYLNVYTKSLKAKSCLPVMMWVHGGAFTFGCGDDMFYGPDYLLRKDIVLVTINYRLGAFGFLNLEDEESTGNQGLKDMVMALRWIQTNISNFGGDPKNVTAFGESSGGSCINLLGLSPMAKGLFHKIIFQSGSALHTWASMPTPKKYAFALSKFLGKDTNDPKEAVEFLRTVDALQLARASEKMRTPEERLQLMYPFGPGVDDKSANPFMPIPIDEAAKNGIEVPCITGYNNQEGIYALFMIKSKSVEDITKNYKKYLHPNMLKMLKTYYNLTVEDLRKIYKNEHLTEENYIEKLVEMMTDMYISEGSHRMIKLQVLSKKAPLYFYLFTYDKGVSFTKLMINTTMSGASHFDELPHLFTMKFGDVVGVEPFKKGSLNYRIMEQMTEMWTNFAKYGRPTPVTNKLVNKQWIPVSNPSIFQYLNIGSDLNIKNMMNVQQRLLGGRIALSKL